MLSGVPLSFLVKLLVPGVGIELSVHPHARSHAALKHFPTDSSTEYLCAFMHIGIYAFSVPLTFNNKHRTKK